MAPMDNDTSLTQEPEGLRHLEDLEEDSAADARLRQSV